MGDADERAGSRVASQQAQPLQQGSLINPDDWTLPRFGGGRVSNPPSPTPWFQDPMDLFSFSSVRSRSVGLINSNFEFPRRKRPPPSRCPVFSSPQASKPDYQSAPLKAAVTCAMPLRQMRDWHLKQYPRPGPDSQFARTTLESSTSFGAAGEMRDAQWLNGEGEGN
ncbi:hypothetical protein ACJZ2D_015243 [Fusarium nematophilum]